MIFKTPDPVKYDYNAVEYTSKTSDKIPPLCSLDFSILTDTGKTIGDTQLRLQNFKGHEALSQPFEFNLELRANDYTSGGPGYGKPAVFGEILSPATSDEMNFENIMGVNATIILGTPETTNDVNQGDYPNKRPVVFFNGIISNFSLADRGVYHATLKPALFRLSLQNNYRIFSQKSILEVIIEVLTENQISFNKEQLEAKPNTIIKGLANYYTQDWLQAGESDLDFITRLMHKVSLFYYFVHSKFKHTMIITDQPYYKSIYQREVNKEGFNVETEKLKSLYLSYTEQASLDRDDQITQFKYQQNLTTQGVTTVLAQKEATWETANTAEVSPVHINMQHQKEKLNMKQMHLVQYGATELESNKMTDTAVNRINAAKFDFSGASSCTELKAGHQFKVKEAWQDSEETNSTSDHKFSSPLPIRPLLNDRDFVATSVQHQASAAGDYKNQFSAVAAEGLATPFSSHSGNQGNIFAIVTGKDKADDKSSSLQGNALKFLKKNVFSFDKKSLKYENNSKPYSATGIYVRFIDQPDTAASTWVKISESMTSIPEMGSYVMVGRSNDDNEIPEVQQSLQAKGSRVIMPQKNSCHTNVGNSYNASYGDSTSISFGADVSTPLETAKNIVDKQRKSNNYNDVRYGESSSYSYNVTKRSHNISITGKKPSVLLAIAKASSTISAALSNPASLAINKAEKLFSGAISSLISFVSYGDSKTYGNTYNKSYHLGTSTNISTQTGMSTSANKTKGLQNSFTKLEGVSTSVYLGIGAETNTSSKTGIFTNISNINGKSTNKTLINGNSTSTTTTFGNNSNTQITTGNSSNNTTMTGNTSNTQITTGNSSNDTTMTGNTSNTQTTTGNATNVTTMTGNTSNTQTTTGNATNITTMTGNTSNTQTTTGNSINDTTMTGNSTNTQTTTGNSTSTATTTGNVSSTNTTTGEIKNTTTVTGNVINTNTNTGNITNNNTHTGQVFDNSKHVNRTETIEHLNRTYSSTITGGTMNIVNNAPTTLTVSNVTITLSGMLTLL